MFLPATLRSVSCHLVWIRSLIFSFNICLISFGDDAPPCLRLGLRFSLLTWLPAKKKEGPSLFYKVLYELNSYEFSNAGDVHCIGEGVTGPVSEVSSCFISLSSVSLLAHIFSLMLEC